jgi:hypothetical protein
VKGLTRAIAIGLMIEAGWFGGRVEQDGLMGENPIVIRKDRSKTNNTQQD